MESVKREQIEMLIKLQSVELESRCIKDVLETLPAKVDELDNRLKEFEDSITEKENTLNELKKQYRTNESDVEINISQISKSDAKLLSVKTNKEYQAILKEIEKLKKKNSCIEDDMLECLDQIESYEREVKKYKEDFLFSKKEIGEEKEKLSIKNEEEKKKLNVCETEYKKIAAEVDPNLLVRYRNIQERTKGTVIVVVKDTVCQGCHMNIPPQMYNELHRSDTLMFCPHCQRMIYYIESIDDNQ